LRPNFSIGLPFSLNNDEYLKKVQIKNFPFGNWLPFYRPSSFASLPFDRFAFIVGKQFHDIDSFVISSFFE